MPVWMRNVLVGLAFTPLLVLVVLVAAIRAPWMDAVTVRMPMGVRTAVAGVILGQAEFGLKAIPALERVVRLEPDNAGGWQRICVTREASMAQRAVACQRAVDVAPTPWNYKAMAQLQEEQGNLSGAEETMRTAQARADTIDNEPALFLRELGRLELINGDMDKSLTDLLQAEKFDARDAEFAKKDDEESADALETDRDYLMVLYDRRHEPEKSAAVCRKTMPKSDKPCGCTMNAKNALRCTSWAPDDAKAD